MSVITKNTAAGQTRPTSVVAAAGLAAITALAYAIPWPGYMDPGVGMVVASIAIEVLFLAGVAGLWALKRWGLFATIAVGSVNAVFNTLSVADTDLSAGLRAAGVGIGILFAVVVVLAALPATRRAIH